MTDANYKPFAPTLPPARARLVPWLTVAAGSLLGAILPLVATVPLLPPFGLLMLLTWRLLARYALRPWAAAPLGLLDDLVSGQPLGSAVLLWSMCFLVIEVIETRLMFRDFWQDWLIAAGAVAFCLVAERWLALPLSARVDAPVIAQIGVSTLLFPVAARLVAAIDRKRGHA